MANRDRGTYTFRHGVTPETMTVISSKCKLYARPSDKDSGGLLKQIGVVSNFNPSESRTIEPVRGIGFGDCVAELVPSMTEPMSLSVTRTAQYLSQIYNVFGYKGGIEGIVRSLRHHKWPFDILQELIISRLDPVTAEMGEVSQFIGPSLDAFDEGAAAIVTSYEGCWFQDYSTSFAADTALVQEDVTILCTDIVAVAANGGVVEYSESSEDLFNKKAVSHIYSV